jgi:ribosomal-protein-alanine N-acetyltransferase
MPPAHLLLRLAHRTDTSTLAAMSRDLIENGLGWHYRAERIERLRRDPEAVTLVACVGGQIVGFAILQLKDDRAHLVLLAVRPDHQQRGIGRRMTHWLLETAATAGVASVHVELRADNVAAHALYSAMGFEETLRLGGYYRGRETAIRMVRVLRLPGVAPPTWSPPSLDKR